MEQLKLLLERMETLGRVCRYVKLFQRLRHKATLKDEAYIYFFILSPQQWLKVNSIGIPFLSRN
jgi:hypothetical protein